MIVSKLFAYEDRLRFQLKRLRFGCIYDCTLRLDLHTANKLSKSLAIVGFSREHRSAGLDGQKACSALSSA